MHIFLNKKSGFNKILNPLGIYVYAQAQGNVLHRCKKLKGLLNNAMQFLPSTTKKEILYFHSLYPLFAFFPGLYINV